MNRGCPWLRASRDDDTGRPGSPSSAPGPRRRTSGTWSCATCWKGTSRGSSTRSTRGASRSAACRRTRASRRHRCRRTWRSSACRPPACSTSCASAARAFTRTKPIVVYKAGRFEESAKAAVSHTGAMAGADAVYEAAFRRAGVTRVLRIQDVFSTAELLSADRPVHRPTLAVVTNAGGPGVMSADALIARHGSLASLAPQTIATLNEALPAAWSHGNPVDVLGDAPALRYQIAADTVLGDPGVDAVLVILTPQAMTDIVGTADAIANAYRQTDKPVLAVWMGGGDLNDEAMRRPRGPAPFGAVIMVAAGALTTEVLKDQALERVPAHDYLAPQMLASVRI